MLKKRLVGVVTVKNEWAVQSFGYGRYLPLGKPECLVENLDRWGADEIFVQCIDRSIARAGPDFSLLRRLARLGLGTPLIYGGGISTVEDGVAVVQSGADRIVLDALLRNDIASVDELGKTLGVQAIIAALPLKATRQGIAWFDYQKSVASLLDLNHPIFSQGLVSEYLIIDLINEGGARFDERLLSADVLRNRPLIVFGGIAERDQMVSLLGNEHVAAIAIGNRLNYQEHAIQKLKKMLKNSALRQPMYACGYSLISYE